ncbi:di-heme cytochrome c peroxidase [Ruegeria sp. PrR005]|uniref:Di-heme cytochrome c peroxidase n=2 Tax=Ruegeria sp. PrR005 TaxID=2706882 RepID=A0A6B2NKY9_9RHOB|nr:di-heme cytochrome c peroxidase [Ruegeria sp. PrR005]
MAEEITLSDTCPPSFQMLVDGTCELVTLYQFYDSPPQHGGLRARLDPPARRYTPQQIDLGRYLFFDPILSDGGDLSCASCHDPAQGFSDGKKRGIGAVELDRSTPTLWNVGFAQSLMWDGRTETLEAQALLPLLNPDEMAATVEGVETALNAAPGYVALFQIAFGAAPNIANTVIALAAFQSSLISLNSRYDRYAHGDATALNPQEIRGMNAFRGFVARCSQCHIPPLFTDFELAVVGAPADERGFADPGAGALSDDPARLGAFKTPTLRNITRTAPYFHAGQFDTLKGVVDFYNNTAGHAAPKGQDLRIHWHVHMTNGPKLSTATVADIIAFLAALEDENLMPERPAVLPSEPRP